MIRSCKGGPSKLELCRFEKYYMDCWIFLSSSSSSSSSSFSVGVSFRREGRKGKERRHGNVNDVHQ